MLNMEYYNEKVLERKKKYEAKGIDNYKTDLGEIQEIYDDIEYLYDNLCYDSFRGETRQSKALSKINENNTHIKFSFEDFYLISCACDLVENIVDYMESENIEFTLDNFNKLIEERLDNMNRNEHYTFYFTFERIEDIMDLISFIGDFIHYSMDDIKFY